MIRPSDAREVEVADVYKGDTLAAKLRRVDGGTEFQYLGAYLAQGGPAVASTLPLVVEPYRSGSGAVPPFFAGLLPEGARLAAVVSAVRTSLNDEMSLLLAVADDPIGDVSIVKSGAPQPEVLQGTQMEPSAVSFRQLFRDSVDPDGETLDRAIPGVQDKLSSAVISFPLTRSDGPSILKLSPEAFPLVVENEAWCLDLAKAAGLAVPRHELVTDRLGVTGLLVLRFDRKPSGAGFHRVAQEDACQFLGRWPADKYRVTVNEIADRVIELASAPQAAVANLVQQVAFSCVVGNGDLHGKNLSLQWRSDEELVAPTAVYDIVSSIPYRRLDDRMALDVDGRVANIQGRFLVAFAERYGVPEALTRRQLGEMIDRVKPRIRSVENIGFDTSISERMAAEMQNRVARLSRFT
ncbi:MAG: hypothetical protein A2Z12_01920 [Actinobacteria bacterium RBG_16_68_21]|nr:MAG: hypothetical protein A2Z12_01920 [Actinobacteria bacterium RBG_16_68_21]